MSAAENDSVRRVVWNVLPETEMRFNRDGVDHVVRPKSGSVLLKDDTVTLYEWCWCDWTIEDRAWMRRFPPVHDFEGVQSLEYDGASLSFICRERRYTISNLLKWEPPQR